MMIKENKFLKAMEDRWTGELNNVPNPALRDTWAQIVQTFNQHIEDHNDPERSRKWTVLQPATGTGKTQGTIVYCSLLAELPEHKQPGVLVVTRLIDEADNIANQINELVGRPFAIAHHSKSETNIDELNQWPVLIVTHRAYELALDVLGKDATIEGTWKYFHQFGSIWDASESRELVVIDEAMDIVEHSQAGLDGLRHTLGAIPESLRNQFSEEIKAIQYVIEKLEDYNRRAQDKTMKEYMLPELSVKTMYDHIATIDFIELRKAMKNVRFDIQNRRNDPQAQKELAALHDGRLRSLQHIFKTWLYYAQHGTDHTFNTARLLVPEDSKGAVVLDATASSSVIYELMEADVKQPPANARSYANVTCHISRGHKLGKRYMSAATNAKKLVPKLIGDLNQRLQNRKVLTCTHKGVVSHLQANSPDFDLHIAHWGKIDGSNEWKDCDTAVIFGLPYLPDTWAANVYMAAMGPVDNAWLNGENRKHGRHDDVRYALKTGQMTVSVVQAINRVQCRKVIDERGNCPVTDVYLMLPNGALADDLLAGIKREMPEIKIVEDWELQMAKRSVRKSDYRAAMISYLDCLPRGRHLASGVRSALGVSKRTWHRRITELADETDLVNELKRIGVRFECIGYGKGHRAYFVK